MWSGNTKQLEIAAMLQPRSRMAWEFRSPIRTRRAEAAIEARRKRPQPAFRDHMCRWMVVYAFLRAGIPSLMTTSRPPGERTRNVALLDGGRGDHQVVKRQYVTFRRFL